MPWTSPPPCARCQRAGLSKRELARRARTSPAAIVAYESGRRSPSIPTLERLLAASGHRCRLTVETGHRGPDPAVAGERLVQVLELAEHLPKRPAAQRMAFPGLP